MILTKTYTEPTFSEKEILRYAGCNAVDAETDTLLKTCIEEAKGKLTYKVCYCELPISIIGDVCDFGVFHLASQNLARNLSNCKMAILFAATIGVEIDRLITKYGRLSPAKAVMFQAIGTERIEALCNVFCADVAKEYGVELKPRFSPGYGDLPLPTQKDIFAILDCGKRIGLTLNDSLMMSPSKSVTAFVGLCDENI